MRLPAVRKRSFWDWKMIQITAIARITRSEARSPCRNRRSRSRGEVDLGRGVLGGGDVGAGDPHGCLFCSAVSTEAPVIAPTTCCSSVSSTL